MTAGRSARPAAASPSGAPPSSITPNQLRLVRAIERRMAANPDVSPSFEELREDLGLSSKSGVSRLVGQLVERGWLRRDPGSPRSLRILVHPSQGVADEHSRPAALLTDDAVFREARERGFLSRAVSDGDLLVEAARRRLLARA